MSKDFIIKKNAPLAAMKALPMLKDLGDEVWETNPKVAAYMHQPSLSRSKNSFPVGGVSTPKSTKETNSSVSFKTQEREPSTTASHNSFQRQLSRTRKNAFDSTIILTPKSNPLISKFPGVNQASYHPYHLPEDGLTTSPKNSDKTIVGSARNLPTLKHKHFNRISSFKLEPLSALDASPRGLGQTHSELPTSQQAKEAIAASQTTHPSNTSACDSDNALSSKVGNINSSNRGNLVSSSRANPSLSSFSNAANKAISAKRQIAVSDGAYNKLMQTGSAFLDSKVLEKNKSKLHQTHRAFPVEKRADRHKETSELNSKPSEEGSLLRSEIGRAPSSRRKPQEHVIHPIVEKSKSSSPVRQETKPKSRFVGTFVSYKESVQGISSNKEKPNQDYYSEREFTLSIQTPSSDGNPVRLRIVADGHGAHGHLVARLTSERLGSLIEQEVKNHYKLGALVLDGGDLAVEVVRRTIKKAFVEIDKELESSNICLRLSGATLTLALICMGFLFLANVGDSTAMLISKQSNQNLIVSVETPIHHPDNREERARIIETGGIVASSSRGKEGESEGPLRVWRKDLLGPGLAVTRSFGDREGRAVGVICNPGN
jgi:serine/threonine protein phosphatase PrpC